MKEHVLVILSLLTATQGSYIVFDKTPDVIKTFFTPSLTLRCSLHLHDKNNDTSPENVVFVTSLSITRNGGQQVASVLPYGPAEAFVDLDKLNVTGHVSHMSGEQGALVLTWQQPLAGQADNYSCEINGLNKRGKNLVFDKTIEVKVGKPDMDDLISHVHQVEVKNQELEAKLNQMMTSGGVVSGGVSHVEGGSLNCPGQDGVRSVSHNFTSSYPRPPLVHLGVTAYLSNSSAYSGDLVTGHYVSIGNVSRDGFTVTCAKTKSSFNFDYITVIDWLSVLQ